MSLIVEVKGDKILTILEAGGMSLLKLFQMPKPVNIVGRTSSITNSFVNGIIPVIYPTEEQVAENLAILGLDPEDLRCAYCGDKYTEWDHLRPIVKGKQPTGYISDIYNLVPACGKCNQSKGNKHWREWIESQAPLSPKSRGITDLQKRIDALNRFERWKDVQPYDFAAFVEKDLWIEHWENWKKLYQLMKESQRTSDRVKKAIEEKINEI